MKDLSAFPHECIDSQLGTTFVTKGLTMRDYFAAKAIEGASVSAISSIRYHHDLLAADAYALADAMLKARETNGL